MSKPTIAVEINARAKEIAVRTADEEAEWRARGNQALAQVDCGDFEEAIRELRKVAAHYEKPGGVNKKPDFRLLGHARFNIAYAYHRQGRTELAREQAEEALRIMSLINDQGAIEELMSQTAKWGQ